MDDKLEKKFYTELVSESYKTTDINKISEKIKKSINVNITRIPQIYVDYFVFS